MGMSRKLYYLGEKILFELWKCIRGFFAFLVFPTSHSPPPSLTDILPLMREKSCLKTKWEFFPAADRARAPLKTCQEFLGLEENHLLRSSFLYPLPGSGFYVSPLLFSCLSSDLLHLGFLRGTRSSVWTGFSTLFWLLIFSTSLSPKFSSNLWLSSHKILPSMFIWKWIILGEKNGW